MIDNVEPRGWSLERARCENVLPPPNRGLPAGTPSGLRRPDDECPSSASSSSDSLSRKLSMYRSRSSRSVLERPSGVIRRDRHGNSVSGQFGPSTARASGAAVPSLSPSCLTSADIFFLLRDRFAFGVGLGGVCGSEDSTFMSTLPQPSISTGNSWVAEEHTRGPLKKAASLFFFCFSSSVKTNPESEPPSPIASPSWVGASASPSTFQEGPSDRCIQTKTEQRQ